VSYSYRYRYNKDGKLPIKPLRYHTVITSSALLTTFLSNYNLHNITHVQSSMTPYQNSKTTEFPLNYPHQKATSEDTPLHHPMMKPRRGWSPSCVSMFPQSMLSAFVHLLAGHATAHPSPQSLPARSSLLSRSSHGLVTKQM